MRRWHLEQNLMKRRKREDDQDMLRIAGKVVLSATGRERQLGNFRKRRPFQSCPPSDHCLLCECERSRKKQNRRHDRYQSKLSTRRHSIDVDA